MNKNTCVWNWLLNSGCVISVWNIGSPEHMEESDSLLYIHVGYTLKGVGCVRVWTHLRYILVLEWCQQIVRYACNIHIAFVC